MKTITKVAFSILGLGLVSNIFAYETFIKGTLDAVDLENTKKAGVGVEIGIQDKYLDNKLNLEASLGTKIDGQKNINISYEINTRVGYEAYNNIKPYIVVSYLIDDIDKTTKEGRGFGKGVGIEYKINDKLFASLEYKDYNMKVSGEKYDKDTTSLGLKYIF